MSVNEITGKGIELKLSTTTIGIKRGTKKKLDSLGSRKETYDDIIRKIIHDNRILRDEIDRCKPENIELKNRIVFRDFKRKNSSFSYRGILIHYSYNIPNKPLIGFSFDVHIKNLHELELTNVKSKYPPALKLYLYIYGKLLRQYIDPLFKVNTNRLLDLTWWNTQLDNLGFNQDTYRSDIEDKLIDFGVMP